MLLFASSVILFSNGFTVRAHVVLFWCLPVIGDRRLHRQGSRGSSFWWLPVVGDRRLHRQPPAAPSRLSPSSSRFEMK
ncbi:hypothetical protein SLA2020_266710 [Shorea laevis]